MDTVIGLDFGRKQNQTALVVLERPQMHVPFIEVYSHVPWHQIIARLRYVIRQFRCSCVIADGGGVGDAIIDSLREFNVLPVTIGSPGFTHEELFLPIVSLLNHRELSINPAYETLVVPQLTNLVGSVTKRGKLHVQGKGKGKRGGVQDDIVFALALALVGCRSGAHTGVRSDGPLHRPGAGK